MTIHCIYGKTYYIFNCLHSLAKELCKCAPYFNYDAFSSHQTQLNIIIFSITFLLVVFLLTSNLNKFFGIRRGQKIFVRIYL